MKKCIICGQFTDEDICPRCGGDTLDVDNEESWDMDDDIWGEDQDDDYDPDEEYDQNRGYNQDKGFNQRYDQDYDEYEQDYNQGYSYLNDGGYNQPQGREPYGREPQGNGYGQPQGQYRPQNQGYSQGRGYPQGYGRPQGQYSPQGQILQGQRPYQGEPNPYGRPYPQGEQNPYGRPPRYPEQDGYRRDPHQGYGQDPRYRGKPPRDEEPDTGFIGEDEDSSGLNTNTKIIIGIGSALIIVVISVACIFLFKGTPDKNTPPTSTPVVASITPTPTLTPKQIAAQQKKKDEELAKKKKAEAAKKKKKAEEKAAKLKEQQRVEFILPDSDTIKLTSEQVKELSNDDLNIAKNELYARHGRIFEDSFLSSYFQGTTWYKPKVQAEAFDDSVFNSVEVYNLQVITKEETRRSEARKKKQEEAKKKKEQEAAEQALLQQQEEARRQQEEQAKQQLANQGGITTTGTRVYSTAYNNKSFSFVYPDSWVEDVQFDTQLTGNQLEIICRNRVCLNAYGDQYGAEVFRLIITPDPDYGTNTLNTQDVDWIASGQLGDYYLYESIPNLADIPEDDEIISIQDSIRSEIPSILSSCKLK